MKSRSWHLPFLLAVAGIAMWLLLAGPQRLLGVDTGNLGAAVLMTVLWLSLWRIGRAPESALDTAMSPGEWRAWVGVGFLGLALFYFVAKLPLFAVPVPVFENPHASAVGRQLVLLLVAWLVLSSVLAQRWKGRVQEDERDRQIAANAVAWARRALVAFVIAVAVTLGFSPADRLHWATPMLLANLLMGGIMLSCLVETGAQALGYWRDRH